MASREPREKLLFGIDHVVNARIALVDSQSSRINLNIVAGGVGVGNVGKRVEVKEILGNRIETVRRNNVSGEGGSGHYAAHHSRGLRIVNNGFGKKSAEVAFSLSKCRYF